MSAESAFGVEEQAEVEPVLTAATADRFRLYEMSVQSAGAELEFIESIYRRRYGRLPRVIREDFCGTANISAHWVVRRPKNVAYAVDLDPEVLAWARQHNGSRLTRRQQERLHLLQGDVLKVETEPVDIVQAMNFSYFIYKSRRDLLRYFRTVRKRLQPKGLFILDCYGGYDAQDLIEEERPCEGFNYVWDQAQYNPVTNETKCHIHFEFPDGSKIERAFTYDWRLWTLAEIRETLEDAGFDRSKVYWEQTDPRTGEGNGIFKPTTTGDVCPGWVAYVVAEPAETRDEE